MFQGNYELSKYRFLNQCLFSKAIFFKSTGVDVNQHEEHDVKFNFLKLYVQNYLETVQPRFKISLSYARSFFRFFGPRK